VQGSTGAELDPGAALPLFSAGVIAAMAAFGQPAQILGIEPKRDPAESGFAARICSCWRILRHVHIVPDKKLPARHG